jgi:hypothetical protein
MEDDYPKILASQAGREEGSGMPHPYKIKLPFTRQHSSSGPKFVADIKLAKRGSLELQESARHMRH